MYNRPLAPHITIYAVQESSLASIWHRISGILLASLIVFCFINVQLLIHSNYSGYFLILKTMNNFLSLFDVLYLLSLFCFFYHILNGFKQILWDLGFFLNQKFIYIYLIIISFIICLFILLLIFS